MSENVYVEERHDREPHVFIADDAQIQYLAWEHMGGREDTPRLSLSESRQVLAEPLRDFSWFGSLVKAASHYYRRRGGKETDAILRQIHDLRHD